jgi:ribonucleoside-diphosphate reductase alpha chain
VYDQAFGEIAQGGTRRGANMAVLNVAHPDVRDFITCKTDENHITNFNISVGATDDFMRAVVDDRDFELVNPQDNSVWEVVQAREIFNLIVKQAHHNGEPGLLFIDAANRQNPVPHLYELQATNPCGEQWLGPYENCCLASVNLAKHAKDDGSVNWDLLRETVQVTTRFLDDVVSANAYVPAVPQLREAALNARRIGLGIMGLADLMYQSKIRYGSSKAQEFAGQVMEFVRYHTMLTSIQLSEERGAFGAIKGSIYDPADLKWTAPRPIFDHSHDFNRPEIDWQLVVKGIREHGIRNAAQTTVAPTGTIATVADCEGYGCEPVFALAYVRHVEDNGNDLDLQYASPLFSNALDEAGLGMSEQESVIEEVSKRGTCQNIRSLPDAIRHTFVVAADITPEEHVRMQASIQAFVDNSISKTCNFAADASEEDVAAAYLLAWELGCKGLTVYVTGSREKVVLETKATKSEKSVVARQITLWPESKKPRNNVLPGETHRVTTPLGNTYVTVNENGDYQPFEVFIQTSKAGSDTAAVSEAIGRLISYVLRLSSPVPPRDRLLEVVKQLNGIGGGRPLGFGSNRVLSLPDGVANVLNDYLDNAKKPDPRNNGQLPRDISSALIGDLCPECGKAAVVNEEGCRKCYNCSFSEC